VESDILQPLPKGQGRIHYVDEREFARLALSRRRLERVSRRAHAALAIRDVGTGEVYELVPRSGPAASARSPALGAQPT
jgi:hypothetical protein